MASIRSAGSVGALLRQACGVLAQISPSPRLDAEVLLAATLGWERSRLFARPEWVPTADEVERFCLWLAGRCAGRPVAYLLGRREFWDLSLTVSEATLIPRPETERLVELALERIAPGHPADLADLGTGSGAVALALGRERPDCRIFASDLSAEALEIARGNALRLGISNVAFFQSDWFDGFPRPRRFEMVVSNPPYVAAEDPALRELRYEPRFALVAGHDGLAAIRRIVAAAPRWLRPGGWVLVEHGANQGTRVAALLERAGFEGIATVRDLGGLNRVSLGRSPRPAPPPGSARTSRSHGPHRQ
jgi:release factor glutamine methyltransferase